MRISKITTNKAIVSSKGQVVLPRVLREELGIHAGSELLFKIRADGVAEIKPIKHSIEAFFGRCKQKKQAPMSIEEMDAAIMRAVSQE